MFKLLLGGSIWGRRSFNSFETNQVWYASSGSRTPSATEPSCSTKIMVDKMTAPENKLKSFEPIKIDMQIIFDKAGGNF